MEAIVTHANKIIFLCIGGGVVLGAAAVVAWYCVKTWLWYINKN